MPRIIFKVIHYFPPQLLTPSPCWVSLCPCPNFWSGTSLLHIHTLFLTYSKQLKINMCSRDMSHLPYCYYLLHCPLNPQLSPVETWQGFVVWEFRDIICQGWWSCRSTLVFPFLLFPTFHSALPTPCIFFISKQKQTNKKEVWELIDIL